MKWPQKFELLIGTDLYANTCNMLKKAVGSVFVWSSLDVSDNFRLVVECLEKIARHPPPLVSARLVEAGIFDWRLFLCLYINFIGLFCIPGAFIIHLSGILLVNQEIYEIFFNIFQSFLFFWSLLVKSLEVYSGEKCGLFT